MFCYKCGAQVNNNAAFCSDCGTKLNGNDLQPVSNNNQMNSKNDLYDYSNSKYKLPMMIANLIILFCPFIKLYSIPALGAVQRYLIGETIVDTSFSFWGWAKILFSVKKEGSDVSNILIIPVVAYSIIYLITAYNYIKMIDHYKANGMKDDDFWETSKRISKYMLIDDILMIAMTYLVNWAFASTMNEKIGASVDVLELNPIIYLFTVGCIILVNVSSAQVSVVTKERDLKMQNNRKSMLDTAHKTHRSATAAYSQSTWVCSACNEVNPSNSMICRSCGKYK